MDLPVDGFASELVVAMRETRSDDLALPEDEALRFVERTVRLRAFESLNSASRAAQLASDYPQLLCTATVVTDLRPVFGADLTQRPVGAVVTHTLRLELHKPGDHEVLHITLDSRAIAKLKEVLDKAEAEPRTVRSLLMETGISDFGEAWEETMATAAHEALYIYREWHPEAACVKAPDAQFLRRAARLAGCAG